MSTLENSSPLQLNATQEKIDANPTDPSINEFIQVYLSDCKKLTDSELLLYGLIIYRSKQKGYAFFKDEHAMQSLNWKIKKVQRTLISLEKKKMIYRNTWHHHNGSERHIVPFERAKDYYNNFLNTDRVRNEPKEKFYEFVKHHFPEVNFPTIPYKQKRAEVPKTGRAIAMVKNDQSSKKADGQKRPVIAMVKNDQSIDWSKMTSHIKENLIDKRKEKALGSAQPPERAASPSLQPNKDFNRQLAYYLKGMFVEAEGISLKPYNEYCAIKSSSTSDNLDYSSKNFIKNLKQFFLRTEQPKLIAVLENFLGKNVEI